MQIKQAKTYREFRKIVRKYTMRRYRKYYAYRTKIDYYWLMSEFVFYDIVGLDALRAFKVKNKPTLMRIIAECIENYGRKVRIHSQKEDVGTLVGIELSPCDYYHIIEREDGSKVYDSCVGPLNWID